MSVSNFSRRGWVAAAVGFGLVGAGSGLIWRTTQRQSLALSQAEDSFWRQYFLQLDGTQLALTGFKGKPLLLNFWATWCPPCVEELPLLNVFYSENKAKGWQVLGLAVDQATPVKRFLAQTPLHFPIALAGFAGIEVSQSLGNLSGGLPYSVMFGADGRVLQSKIGKLGAGDLQRLSALTI